MDNGGQVHLDDDAIMVVLKKKRHVPLWLSALERFQNQSLYWMQNRKIRFIADTSSVSPVEDSVASAAVSGRYFTIRL